MNSQFIFLFVGANARANMPDYDRIIPSQATLERQVGYSNIVKKHYKYCLQPYFYASVSCYRLVK
jgi:hypothetical protein